jgi:hypothetical protein
MSKSIAINGSRLDEVRMPLPPYAKGVVSSLLYPMSAIRFERHEGTICLVLPAYLSVELYRVGILPQEAKTPIEISISGRSAGRYVVSDVRYPKGNDQPFGAVTFTLTRVAHRSARGVRVQPAPERVGRRNATHVTDIKHYLDKPGELMRLPGPARKLASFLSLLIEAATGCPSAVEQDSGIRCRAKACRGTIRTLLPPNLDEIIWHCPVCGHNGVIRNWSDTKWNQLKRIEGSE